MRRKIGVQLVLAVTVASLIVFGLLSYSLLESDRRAMLEQMTQHADQMSETIKSSTRYAMLLNRREDVHRIIDTIAEQEEINTVRVLNKEGRVIYSSDKDEIGTLIDKKAEACFTCHAADAPLQRLSIPQRARTFRDRRGISNIGIISAIYNETACSQAACHAHIGTQSILGILDLTMSREAVDRQIVQSRNRAILLTLASILCIGVIIGLLFHVLIGKPVRELVDATKNVGSGDFEYRIHVRRNDELGQLGHSFNDMTERMTEVQSQLYQANKLASIGRLGAGIAHEINNPLTGILSFSSLLLSQAEEGSETHAELETIVHEAKRCREIVKGLLDFSRETRPRQNNLSVNTVVKRALAIVEHQFSVNDIKVTLTLEDPLPDIRGNDTQLAQVFINLLVNAADSMPPQGGEIFVGTDLEEVNGQRFVRIKIADSGCGIAQDDLDRIFEPFFSTKGTEGTGLGLSVVWGIIQEHGGSITVRSEPQRGAAFTIRLPARDSSSADSPSRTGDAR